MKRNAAVKKYDIYVQLHNTMLALMNNLNNYFRAVCYEEEFLLRENGKFYKYGIILTDQHILEATLSASDDEPKWDKMDSIVKHIAESMQVLTDIFSKIHSSIDYADNQYAKAKEWHSVIIEYAEEFCMQAETFAEDLDIISHSMGG